MLTMERRRGEITPERIAQLPEVEYPAWKIAELEADYREAMEDLRAGRIVPMTAAEFAAAHGIKLGEAAD